jgi:hypothetical protein
VGWSSTIRDARRHRSHPQASSRSAKAAASNGLQVRRRLADPVADRHIELLANRQHDPALGRPVGLGQDHAGDVDDSVNARAWAILF